MRVLQVGLDEKTIHLLAENSVFVQASEGVASADEFLHSAKDGTYDALVIDLDATEWGSYMIRTLKETNINVPVVGIAHGDEQMAWQEQRALFLESGGDDLIRGPVHMRELVASLRALSRRLKGSAIDILTIRSGEEVLKIDRLNLIVTINGARVRFTRREFQIIEILAVGVGQIHSKETIIQSLGLTVSNMYECRIIDVLICRIRRKLSEHYTGATALIETVRGQGHRLNASRS